MPYAQPDFVTSRKFGLSRLRRSGGRILPTVMLEVLIHKDLFDAYISPLPSLRCLYPISKNQHGFSALYDPVSTQLRRRRTNTTTTSPPDHTEPLRYLQTNSNWQSFRLPQVRTAIQHGRYRHAIKQGAVKSYQRLSDLLLLHQYGPERGTHTSLPRT